MQKARRKKVTKHTWEPEGTSLDWLMYDLNISFGIERYMVMSYSKAHFVC